ncbi:MAG: hypothetical protein HYY52_07745 [Candidatus Melainabacteria bacterium]|nr:hypothetical protein [Candidatus Melainabacteria bacterium]
MFILNINGAQSAADAMIDTKVRETLQKQLDEGIKQANIKQFQASLGTLRAV